MHTTNHIYYHEDQALLGYLAYDDKIKTPRPAVLVVHDWSGRNDFACQKAEQLAKLGYIGFAVDMYGEGRLGETMEQKQALMQPVVSDRQLLRARIVAGLDAVLALEQVDARRVAVIGFCFGGLCALDLARSGANIVAAITFHGLLNKPVELATHPMNAKILALHGYDDPMVTPADVHAFCQEMTDAGVDWQMHMYGHTQHAFTNPLAHDESLGTIYNANASRRSWHAMTHFLEEVFTSNLADVPLPCEAATPTQAE
ncbi:MAG TPA: hypothetical protein DDY37_02615 [Legionella sp.]|nr:hypothetical protein [Legionella sp.]